MIDILEAIWAQVGPSCIAITPYLDAALLCFNPLVILGTLGYLYIIRPRQREGGSNGRQ